MSNYFLVNRYTIVFALFILLWCCNIGIDIMEVDAAQYASISRDMAASSNFLHVFVQGKDYLDKPPMLFWLSSISIKIFGVSELGFKLPSLLFLAFAVWVTFQLGTLWYDRKVGLIASIILISTQAFHLMSLDIRTDGLMTAFVVTSIWQLSLFLKKGKWLHLILGGISIACAMMTKGPLGLFIPGVAIGGHLLMKTDWKRIFSYKWIVMVLVIGVMLVPMCYGLYTQFDLHPEKEVYGLKGPSGLKFFFWTQSFGRITGESTWDNNLPWHFFLGSMGWDMQPWYLFFISALIFSIVSIFKKENRQNQPEWISFFGFIIPFMALSMSRYKLPHYIFPLFPFAAIMTASFIYKQIMASVSWMKYVTALVIHLLIALSLLIAIWVFPDRAILWVSIILLTYGFIMCFFLRSSELTDKVLIPIVMSALVLQFTLTLKFYPELLKLQGSSQAGKWLKQNETPALYSLDEPAYALDFYSNKQITHCHMTLPESIVKGSWVYVTESNLHKITSYKVITTFTDYPVTRLSPTFLNPKTRESKLKKVFIVELM